MRILVKPNICLGVDFGSDRERAAWISTLEFPHTNPSKQQVENPYWSGMVSFWLDPGQQKFPTGFLPHVLTSLNRQGFSPQIEYVHQIQRDSLPIDPDVCDGMTLRPYQIEAVRIAMLQNRGVITAPPRSGKTLIQAALAKTLNRKSVIFVEKQALVQQHFDNLKKWGLDPGVVQGSTKDFHKQHTIAMLQTVHRGLSDTKMQEWLNSLQLMQIDECFPAGTLVDGRRIESIKAGDLVRSYNHTTGLIELKRVVRTFKNKSPKELLVVRMMSGESIICTPNHPFYSYSRSSYVAARDLTSQDKLLRNEEVQGVWCRVYSETPIAAMLFSDMCSRRLSEKTEVSGINMPSVWIFGNMCWEESACDGEAWKGILFRRLQEDCDIEKIFRNHGSYEPKVCIKENAGKQSVMASGCKGAHICSEEGSDFFISWRKWAIDQAAVGPMPSTVFGHEFDGVFYPNCICSGQVRISSELLQGRYCYTGNEVGHRGRWKLPQNPEMEVSRCSEDIHIECVGVDCVEVLELGCGRKDSGVCADGYVYNFEVEGNNNYFVDGILVHNCHHASAETYYRAALNSPASWRIGYSGTPYSLVDLESRKFNEDTWRLCGLFGPPIYSVTLDQLRELGLMVSVNIIQVKRTSPDIRHIPGTDWHKVYTTGVAESQERDADICALACGLIAKGYRPLILVKYVAHGERLLTRLHDAGLTPLFAKGGKMIMEYTGSSVEVGSGSVVDAYQKMMQGHGNALIATQIADEGVDFPHIDSLILATGGKADQVTTQRIFRPLTATAGKTRAIVFDFADETHGVLKTQSATRRRIYGLLGFDCRMLPIDRAIAAI